MKRSIKQILLILLVGSVLTTYPCFAQENTTFSDVPKYEWYSESVEYVFENGLMNGTSKTTFEPASSITRGMIVTIIYRMEGMPAVVSESKYTDVNKEFYYYSPIVWATENGIVNGYSKEIFAPNDRITREQFAAILYRYADYKGLDVSFDLKIVEALKKYDDNSLINDYAKDAISWANHSKLITGTSVTTLEPHGTATRAQAATIFMRFDKWIEEAENEKSNEQKTDETSKDNEEPDDDKDVSADNSQNESIKENETPTHTNNTDKESERGTSNEEKEPDNTTDNNDTEIDYQGLYLKVNDSEITSGNNVEINVSLENNPGIMGMMISFEYDEKAMKLVKVLNGNVLTDENGYVFTSPRNMASGCRASWYTLEDECTMVSGTVVTLVFEVFDSTQKGSYPVTVSYNSDDVIDMNEENLALEIINGQIIVE